MDQATALFVDTTTVTLHAARRMSIDLMRASEALTHLDWLGPEVDGPVQRDGLRRVSTDLEFAIRDRSGSGPIRKSALIDVGAPRFLPDGALVDISWQSASLAPLFPVFAGHVRIRADGLVLDGRYAPPFGRLGLLIDASVLHLAARRTADAFLAKVAARMVG